MSTTLLLGIAALLLGLGTFVVRAVLRRDDDRTSDTAALFAGPFAAFTFGLVPLLAAMFFFGAWWMESPAAPEIVVQRPVAPT